MVATFAAAPVVPVAPVLTLLHVIWSVVAMGDVIGTKSVPES